MKNKNKFNFKKTASILQVLILVFGILAVGWAQAENRRFSQHSSSYEAKCGSEVRVVKAGGII